MRHGPIRQTTAQDVWGAQTLKLGVLKTGNGQRVGIVKKDFTGGRQRGFLKQMGAGLQLLTDINISRMK